MKQVSWERFVDHVMCLNYSHEYNNRKKGRLEIINFLSGHKHMLFAVKLVNSMNMNTETVMQDSFSCAICTLSQV